jgi:L-fuconolactonase
MIIDSHVHVWVQQPALYPWSPVGGYVPQNEASIESLLTLMDANNVEGAVLVQPTPYGWDNRYLLDAARIAPNRFRTVCLVDPSQQNSASEMQKLVQESGANGFRFNWHLKPVEEWKNNSIHHDLWKMADKLNCPLCIQCTLDYVPLLQDFAKKHPSVRIVIDHLGKPNTSFGVNHPKFQELLSLADLKNVYIKLSGFYYASSQPAPFNDVLLFVQAIISAFDAHRCLWGSDFPFVVDRWNYASSLNWLNELVVLSAEDRSWILGKTAQKLWW